MKKTKKIINEIEKYLKSIEVENESQNDLLHKIKQDFKTFKYDLLGTNKLRILVDMDSVLAQDVKYALKLYNQEYKTNLTMRDIKGWDIDNYVPKGTSILKYFFEPGFFDKLEPMPNSRKVVKKLIEEGHEIIIATASPASGVFDKINWLKEYYPFIPEENFVSIKKKYLLQADIILDDAAHNLENASVIYPVMFYAYHNKDNNDFLKVHNWNEFYDFVQKIVKESL